MPSKPKSSKPNPKKVKGRRKEREQRWGVWDMFVDRPTGDAGLVMLGVWGSSEAEFAEIVTLELKDEQRRHPDRFRNKIKPRNGDDE